MPAAIPIPPSFLSLRRIILNPLLKTNQTFLTQLYYQPLSASPNPKPRCQNKVGYNRVERRGYGGEGLQSLHPLDADLNLPPELYSHQVRRCVAEEAAEGSFDKVVEALSKTTGAQVGKRQVEELVGRAAQDFDAFYQERQAGALQESESGPILAISVDGKGVVLRGEDLREATRQRAEASEHKRQKRLSKGEKRHAKRMATVAAVYTLAPQVRRPEEVMRVLAPQPQREERNRPRPQHKRLWASLEKRPEEVIEQALGEARSRDPTGRKSWVVLVDGHRSQLKTLVRCLRRSGRAAPTIVLDFIHVSEYVWKAGRALHGEVNPKLEGWEGEHLLSILRGRSGYVAGGIRRSATRRGLAGNARQAVDRGANYLLKNAGYLQYDQYLAKGFPIATGVIEGACRYLVKDRDGGDRRALVSGRGRGGLTPTCVAGQRRLRRLLALSTSAGSR